MRTFLLSTIVTAGVLSFPSSLYAEIPSDKAEIILEAYSLANEGYQMALDADHSAYGLLFYEWSQYYMERDYSAFEYLIPEDAECSSTSSKAVTDGESSITVPAGTYDFMIVYTLGDEVDLGWMNIANNGMYDDFEFKGGCSYRFKVEEGYVSLYVDKDASVSGIILPAKSPDLTSQETVSVVIANNGTSDISGFSVSYQIDDGTPVTETYNGKIAAGASGTHTFAAKADFSAEKSFRVKARVSLDGDAVPSNDSAEAKCMHTGVAELPLVYDFSEKGSEAFDLDWTAIDSDGDGFGWFYNEYGIDPDQDEGCAQCNGTDDTLVSMPVRLEAGINHISFYAKYIGEHDGKNLDISFGRDISKPETLDGLATYSISRQGWTHYAINFNVSETGIYYFSFRCTLGKSSSIQLDEITIEAGALQLLPKPVANKVVLPFSNCSLSAQTEVGVTVSNEGLAPASAINLSYSVNGGASVIERHEVEIAPYETHTIYFDTPADFSAPGTYDVSVCVYIDNGQQSEISATVENSNPIEDFPVYTNFYENHDTDIWHEITPGTWLYEDVFQDFYGNTEGIENGLVSKCLYLDRPARIKLSYGESGWNDTSFNIAFGKAGDDLSDFNVIYNDNDPRTAKEIEITVPVNDAGNYNFVLYLSGNNESHSFHLYECTISKVYDNDLQLSSIHSPYSYHTPISQLDAEAEFKATIVNRGMLTATGVLVSIYEGNSLLATSDSPIDIEAGGTATISLKAGLRGNHSTGDCISDLSMNVYCDQTDQYNADNTLDVATFELTDSEFATEDLIELYYGVGASEPISFGNIYTVSKADVINAVSIGFINTDDNLTANLEIGFAIYRVSDDMTLDTQIYSTKLTRGYGGLTNLNLPPMLLSPGKYFFEVQQLNNHNIGLASQSPTEEHCYQNIDGALQQKDNATLVIRAMTDSDATVYSTDATVTGLISPSKTEKLFSSDETISVCLRNNGYNAADIPVTCSVNGTRVGSVQTFTLDGYESVSVDFHNIDMSEPGEYDITVSTRLPGDENPDNDILAVTLTSIEPASPYTMDFESCNDFDISSDIFNPQWRSVCLNPAMTNAFWAYEYPYKEEGVGFIAFNPAKTTPSLADEGLFLPHSGERFGAAFCADLSEDSDTWLISPQLQLGSDSRLELYVKTFETGYYNVLEKYQVLVSDSDDEPDSFIVLGDDERLAPLDDWGKVEVDLSEYDGKPVYVAIRYIGEAGKNFVLMVDDISVITEGAGISEITVGNDDATDATTVYYNLQGIRVQNLRPGHIYIEAKGNRARKIMAK